MKPKYIVILLLLLVAAGAVGWKIQNDKKNEKVNTYVPPKEQQEQPAQSLGAQVYEQSQNPVAGQVPDTNPFEASSANAIEGSYTNPF